MLPLVGLIQEFGIKSTIKQLMEPLLLELGWSLSYVVVLYFLLLVLFLMSFKLVAGDRSRAGRPRKRDFTLKRRAGYTQAE